MDGAERRSKIRPELAEQALILLRHAAGLHNSSFAHQKDSIRIGRAELFFEFTFPDKYVFSIDGESFEFASLAACTEGMTKLLGARAKRG